MFDFRYHALSLVAVFLALGIGILLGVTIGDSLVSQADRGLRDSLREDLIRARERQDVAVDGLEAREELIAALLPELVRDRLRGERVGLLSLGPLPQGLEADVRTAVELSGGELGPVVEVAADPEERERAELVAATRRRLGSVDAAAFHTAGRVDAAQTWGAEVIDGLRSEDVEVVGVEASGPAEQSQVPFYADQDIASVDNVDSAGGSVALVLALDGAEGRFGYKRSAEDVIPDGAIRLQR